MKPKRLEFCGINSFSEKAVIDFEKLLAGGLFGIFGDTGSGKTTILDSMIFALYGKADRSRGGNASDIINYNCDKAYVVFDFECEWQGKRKIFRVHRGIKRKNSQQELELCELDGGTERPLSEGVKKTNELLSDIIGLSFEDFKKCIALPQGEFAQFVKADRGERLRLIARLFDLETYGDKLNAVLKSRFDAVKIELAEKDGRLSEYTQYTPEELKKLEDDFADLTARKQALDADFAARQSAYELFKKEYERSEKFAVLRTELDKAQAQSAQFEEKRSLLRKLPFAEEAAEAYGSVQKADNTIILCRKEKERSDAERMRAEETLKTVETGFVSADYDNAIADIRAKRAYLQTLGGDVQELTLRKAEREKLAKEYKAAAADKAAAAKELETLQGKVEALQKKAGEQGESPDKFLRENFESALLLSEYAENAEYFSSKLDELRARFLHEGELYFAAEDELSARAAHYKKLCEGEKFADAGALLEAFRKSQSEQAAVKDSLHQYELNREKTAARLSEAEGKLSRLAEDGAKIKNQIDLLTGKLADALGGGVPEDIGRVCAQLEEKEKQLIAERDQKRELQETLRKRIQESAVSSVRAEEKIAALQKERAAVEQLLEAKLAAAEFADVSQARAILDKAPAADALQAEIEQYDNGVRELQASMRALTENGEPRPVSAGEFAAKTAEFSSFAEQKEKIGKDCAVSRSNIDAFALKLKAKKELEKERSEVKKRFDLIEKMRRLFYGNSFMEFVAGEYLSDISASATETLLKLTGGRYFIRYEQGFLVGDNFNAGELRSVNTLSGGETFLVSLSLALSLSAAIYAKSLRPIEFFFLDEGFGTLDEKLIDTVMDSLEKLKNTHFSIGLISHVEELKHRIGNKITVISAPEAGGSSKIKITC